ncbi:hypothetical protein B484DRAFT_403779, partial [Ochromonadaceae sp. CCMP2298]
MYSPAPADEGVDIESLTLNVREGGVPTGTGSGTVSARTEVLEAAEVAEASEALEAAERAERAETLSSSSFNTLGGAAEQLLVMKILPFLTAEDLCSVSKTSLFLHRIADLPALWTCLYERDFLEGTGRIETAKQEGVQGEAEARRGRQVAVVESLLDLTQ